MNAPAACTETEIVLPVTLNGETREVTFYVSSFDPNRAYSHYHMIGRCGRTGKKKWPANLCAWKQKDGSWRVDYTFYRLNRNTGRVNDWKS